MKTRQVIFSAIAGATVLIAGANTATAAPTTPTSQVAKTDGQEDPSRARLKLPPQLAKYSDEEILEMLLAAQGPIAEKNPELINKLGFDKNKPRTNQAALDEIIAEYLARTPDFNQKVSKPFQSGDPEKVEGALKYLTETFQPYAAEKKAEHEEKLARGEVPVDNAAMQGEYSEEAGWTYTGAYVAVAANAVVLANAAVYANAALATFAVATLALVTWYLPDESGNDSTAIEREKTIAELTKAASR